MRVRPGRLLPSVIVGGLLASGLALGAGTASAATTCEYGGKKYPVTESSQIQADGGGNCEAKPGLLNVVLGTLMDTLEPIAEPDSLPPPAPVLTTTTTAAPTTTRKPVATTPKAPPAALQGAGGGGQNLGAAGPVVGAPAPLVAPPAGAAAGPLGAFSPAAFGGIAPAGLASNLFGANTYDPGLLFGSPLGGAAAQLFNPQAGSGVTTVSQAQVLSGPGRGYGTPATIGVIILACLIGFAVRHRVITRMKARDLPEDTTPRHAAPEVEQIDDESDARTTVLTH